MVTKEIEIVVKKDKAEKSLDDVKKGFEGVDKEAKKTNDTVNDGLDKTEKSSKKASKGVGFLSKGFKGLGTAIKASGIGLVVGIIAGLTSAFTKNQKVMDAVNTVFETTSIIFSEITNALVNTYEAVAKNSENFNGLGKVLGGLLNIAITPLKLSFYGIKLAIQEGQLAWEKSFLGGNDKGKIKELTLGILETKQNIIDTGKEAIQSGIDIVTNFGDAVNEVGTIGTKVGEELSKVSVKSAFEQAKVNVQLKNTAQLAVAQQQLLVEKYDILAEKQRQIRDEERNTIDERIKANNDLADVLEKQQKAMLAAADAQIASAQAELQKNNTIENQVALTDALANKQGVLAQIEGFRSEQLVNDLALKREQIELDNTISDREKQRQLDKLDFEAELEKNEADKNIKLQERLDLENEKILADLERKRELFKEGTLARVEAEQDYLDAKQAIDFKQKKLDEKTKQEELEREQTLSEAKKTLANNTANLLIQIAGKQSKIGKALAIASIIREQIQSGSKALGNMTVANAKAVAASPLTGGQPFVGINTAQTLIGIASNALSAKQAISQITSGSTSGGSLGGASGGSQPQSAPAPSFNLVQGTETNQISESISGLNDKPVKAFVVATEVTTAQQAERNKITESSI